MLIKTGSSPLSLTQGTGMKYFPTYSRLVEEKSDDFLGCDTL
jgi:hypothetical protein